MIKHWKKKIQIKKQYKIIEYDNLIKINKNIYNLW